MSANGHRVRDQRHHDRFHPHRRGRPERGRAGRRGRLADGEHSRNLRQHPDTESGTGTVQVYLGPLLSNGTLPLSYRHFESVNHSATTAIVNGTAGNDIIVVDASTGIVTVNGNAVNYTGTSALVINCLAGDDSVTFVSGSAFAGGVTVLGGDPTASDLVTIADANPSIDFNTNQITGVIGDAITLSGVEKLTVNGTDGVADGFSVNGYGTPPTCIRSI